MEEGPFTEWADDGPIHYGSGWPDDPFDWRFGCGIVRSLPPSESNHMIDPAPDTEQDTVGRLDDQHGLGLIEHYLLYGATGRELDALSAEQVTTLAAWGVLRPAEDD